MCSNYFPWHLLWAVLALLTVEMPEKIVGKSLGRRCFKMGFDSGKVKSRKQIHSIWKKDFSNAMKSSFAFCSFSTKTDRPHFVSLHDPVVHSAKLYKMMETVGIYPYYEPKCALNNIIQIKAIKEFHSTHKNWCEFCLFISKKYCLEVWNWFVFNRKFSCEWYLKD